MNKLLLIFIPIFFLLWKFNIYSKDMISLDFRVGLGNNEHFFLYLYQSEITPIYSLSIKYFSNNRKINYEISNNTSFFFSNIYLKNRLWYKTDKTMNFELNNLQYFRWRVLNHKIIYFVYGLSLNNLFRVDVLSLGILYYYKDLRYSFIPSNSIGLGININKFINIEAINSFGVGFGKKDFYIFEENIKSIFEFLFLNKFEIILDAKINNRFTVCIGYQNRFLLFIDNENFLGKGFWLNYLWTGIKITI